MKSRTKLYIVLGIVVAIAIFLIYKNHMEVQKQNQFKTNISELEKESKKNISDIEEELKVVKQKNGIKPVTISNRIAFDDAVFIGDSLTEPLSYYEILSQSNVLSKVGLNLKTAHEVLGNLENLNPKKAFLLFGLNDVENKDSTETFIKNYDELIMTIRSKVPNIKIYIISILPVKDYVSTKKPALSNNNLAMYNAKLMDFAKEKGYTFIDATKLAIENQNLYEPDGQHFKRDFYPLYLDLIKVKLTQEQEKQVN